MHERFQQTRENPLVQKDFFFSAALPPAWSVGRSVDIDTFKHFDSFLLLLLLCQMFCGLRLVELEISRGQAAGAKPLNRVRKRVASRVSRS